MLLFYFTLAPSREETVVLRIPSGSSVSQIARILEENDVIRDRFSFRLLVQLRGMGRDLRAGQYMAPAGLPLWEVIDLLATGQGEMVKLTLPEGLTDRQVFARMTGVLPGLDSLELARLSRSDSMARSLGFDSPGLGGYLFPETYLVPPNISEPEVLRLVTERFKQVRAGLLEGRTPRPPI